MTALLIFHLKAGMRIALRSFLPLFSALLIAIMLDLNPAGVVIGQARTVFASRPLLVAQLPVVVLAFLLPAWAAPKLIHGLNGWMRHLPFSGAGNRRGMALALFVVQMPLAVSLACLALVAGTQGMSITVPSLRWLIVMIAGALASLPVHRKLVTLPASAGAALCALQEDWRCLLPAAALLIAAEFAAGPLRAKRRHSRWHAATDWLTFRIALRALGWRTFAIHGAAMLPLAAMALFLRNNTLAPSLAGGAARLGGSLAAVIMLAGLADKLAIRRPAWPLARSFPWSSSQRVTADALFLFLHALLPASLVALRHPGAAACILGLLPFLALRAAGDIRRAPLLRTGARPFLIESFCLAALLSLLPWTALLGIAAAPAAFVAARNNERRLKVTRWSDVRHTTFGDTLSWSAE
jgi:hypothetical protein